MNISKFLNVFYIPEKQIYIFYYPELPVSWGYWSGSFIISFYYKIVTWGWSGTWWFVDGFWSGDYNQFIYELYNNYRWVIGNYISIYSTDSLISSLSPFLYYILIAYVNCDWF